MKSKMKSSDYSEGYWERGEGSNYVSYGDDPGWGPTAQVMAEWHLEIGDVLYEIASAKGYFLKAARNWSFNAHGIDISEYAVSCAPPEVKPYLQVGNAVQLPWTDESADIVCSWEFLEHVYEDEVPQVLSEMDRVLKPGGYMWHRIGIDLEGDVHPSASHHHQADVTHHTEYPADWWRDKFENKLGYRRDTDREDAINTVFADRDWSGRYFVYRKPDWN